MVAIFESRAWQTADLVSNISLGQIQLPDLQRPFIWEAAKVRDLFDSMYRGYPVGSLMFWDARAPEETRRIGLKTPDDQEVVYQVVDGQQRLTSLYAVMKGQPVRDKDYQKLKIVLSFNPFIERFEVRSPAIAKSPQWIEDVSSFFDSRFRAEKAFVERYQNSGNEFTDEQHEQLSKVFGKLEQLAAHRFDVIHLKDSVEKRRVADVFVRINSEGVRLRAADYILTWLSVFWPQGREQIEEFARSSRWPREAASEITGAPVKWTPHNHYIDVEPGHVVRAMVAVG